MWRVFLYIFAVSQVLLSINKKLVDCEINHYYGGLGMDSREKYQVLFRELLTHVAEIIFIKANGELRPMLCTRNAILGSLFGFDLPYMTANVASHDRRCSIDNGNIAVIDLVIGEGRSFNIDRVVCVHVFDSVETPEAASNIRKDFTEFAQAYKKCCERHIEIDELSNADGEQSESGRFVRTPVGLAVITPFGVYPKSAEPSVRGEINSTSDGVKEDANSTNVQI